MVKKILCVDDDQDVLDCMEYLLSDEGYEVRTLLSPEDLFRQIRAFQPNLITLDINLNSENGLEVCKLITSNPSTSRIPVVIVSGYDEVYSFKAYGAAGMIKKPFNIDAFLASISEYLSAKIIPLFPSRNQEDQMLEG